MPSSIQLIAKLIHETIGIVVRFDHTGSSFKGQNKAPGSIMRISGGVKPREGCQIIFEIATIPAEEKLLTAPILQAIFAGPFPGVFTVKPTTHGSTIYYRLQYPLTSLALNATLQIVKDLEQVRGVGEEIRRYLPVKPLSSDVKGLFEGLNMARYISPLSDDLQEKVRSLIPGDSFLILDALLGQRILFLECDHFYQRNLALSWIAGELKHWDLTVARLIALRYADNDLLDLLQKVPFALAANISGYIHQHQPDEVERLCEQIREIARPFIGIIASPDLALDPKLSVGTKVSLRKFCPEPGIWLDYFLEDYEPAVSQMEKDKVSKELLPVFNSFSTSETSPDLIKSCIQRYFNKQRNSSDPLKSMKEYLFKVVEI